MGDGEESDERILKASGVDNVYGSEIKNQYRKRKQILLSEREEKPKKKD